MNAHEIYDAALARLRTDGTLSDDDLLALCDGDADLARTTAERLVKLGEAAADGFDLRFTGTVRASAIPAPLSAGMDEPALDLFVSYAHTDDDDLGMVRALVERVQALQVKLYAPRPPSVFYDRRDIHLGQDWRQRIYEKIGEAKAMLVVLSPAYFESDFCREEWELFKARELELAHSEGAILPLYAIEIPGFEFDPDRVEGSWMKDLARRQWKTDVSGLWRLGPQGWQGDEAPASIELIRQRLSDLVDKGERALSSRTTVPKPSKYFVGRTLDLKRLRDRLVDGRVGSLVAAQGIGGMGKSALAYAYAHTHVADYPGGRYLIPSEGQTDLRASVLSLATPLGIGLSPEESRDPAAALARVLATVTEKGQALLVFDNVSEPSLLAPHQVAHALPPTGIHALATSRLTEAELHLDADACQEVGPLPDDDALRLFDRYRPFEAEPDPAAAREAAQEMVAWLGGYTLALEVVAVHLWQNGKYGVTYPDVRDRLAAEGFARLEATGATPGLALSLHAETKLSSLLAPTLDALTDAERAVLHFAAVLPPDAVVWPWLRTLVAQAHPGLVPEHVPGDPDPWLSLRERLHGLRLLTPGDDDRISTMHRLVSDVARDRFSDVGDIYLVMIRDFVFDKGRDIIYRKANFWDENYILIAFSYIVNKEKIINIDEFNSSVPPPSRYFVGRGLERMSIYLRLVDSDGGPVFLSGFGGAGKSALAFSYASEFAVLYPGGRYLVPSEGQTDLRASVLSLATPLGIGLSPEESRDPAAALARVLATVTEKGQALLVFDNVSEPSLLAPHQVAHALPPTGIHALATSRLASTDLPIGIELCVELGPMPSDDALGILELYRPFDQEVNPGEARAAAREIVDLLSVYPLALEVVAVHLWQNKKKGVTYSDMRDRLAAEGFARLEATGDTPDLALSLHTETKLSSLLAPTLDALTDAERAVLHFAAVLPPDAVVWPWLRTLVAQAHPGLVPEHVLGDPDPWLTIENRLHSLRLLTPGDDNRVSRMHPLVRGIVRKIIDNDLLELDLVSFEFLLLRAGAFVGAQAGSKDSNWERGVLVGVIEFIAADNQIRADEIARRLRG